ncbi:MAG TPA: AbrB/MazE/SpoVT family DNA-binding domain-containing protein [Patescibacteria group bacterium]|nr:AbrB/MazE/SpoVT family DNA-binding domain-containing protein [Patescibacteria group bacterium]
MHKRFVEKILAKNKMYGSVVVGSKGQVVIPVNARKDMHIRPGDSLIVMGKMGQALGLMKAEALEGLVNMLMDKVSNISEGEIRDDIKFFARRVLKSIPKK